MYVCHITPVIIVTCPQSNPFLPSSMDPEFDCCNYDAKFLALVRLHPVKTLDPSSLLPLLLSSPIMPPSRPQVLSPLLCSTCTTFDPTRSTPARCSTKSPRPNTIVVTAVAFDCVRNNLVYPALDEARSLP